MISELINPLLIEYSNFHTISQPQVPGYMCRARNHRWPTVDLLSMTVGPQNCPQNIGFPIKNAARIENTKSTYIAIFRKTHGTIPCC